MGISHNGRHCEENTFALGFLRFQEEETRYEA
jgi:hypothetical protein